MGGTCVEHAAVYLASDDAGYTGDNYGFRWRMHRIS